MSHFAVLVTSKNEITEELLTPMMQPWHEFECTGYDDEYVRDMNITEDALSILDKEVWFGAPLKPGASELPEENGVYYTYGEDRAKEHLVDGGTKGTKREYIAQAGISEVEYIVDYYGYKVVGPDEELDREGDHKYGYLRVDADGGLVQVVDRTNPNKKWDYWLIGGRYSNRLRVKGHPVPCNVAQYGQLDLDAMKASITSDRDKYVGAACRGVIEKHPHLDRREICRIWSDFVPLQEELRADMEKLAKRPDNYSEWVTANYPSNDARHQCFKHGIQSAFYWHAGVPDTVADIDAWINDPEPLSMFAFLHEDTWNERGEMGWWATVTDEKDEAVWQRACRELFDSLEPTDWIAIVDCHI